MGGSYEPTDDVGFTLRFKCVGKRFSNASNTLLLGPYPLLDGSVYWSPGPCGSPSPATTCSTNGTLPPGARAATR